MSNYLSRALFAGFTVVVMSLAFMTTAHAQSDPNPEGYQETTVTVELPDVEGGWQFYEDMGFRQVFPGFWLTPQQRAEMVRWQCTAGPNGLFAEERENMAEDGYSWCSRRSNDRLSRYLKSGARAWLLTAMPTSMRYTIYDQAVNRNQNVKCWADIPPGPLTRLALTCVDTKNGAQVVGDTISGVIRAFVPLAGATVLDNVTAPSAGDTILESSSDANNQTAVTAGASANARSEGSPVTVNNINQLQQAQGFDPTACCTAGYVRDPNQR